MYAQLYHAIIDSIITICLRLNPDLTPKRIEDAIDWSGDGIIFSSESPAWIGSEGEVFVYVTRPWVGTPADQLAVAVGTHGTYVGVDLRSLDLRGELDWSHCQEWLVKLGWLHSNQLTRQNVPATESPFEHAVRRKHIPVLKRMVQFNI